MKLRRIPVLFFCFVSVFLFPVFADAADRPCLDCHKKIKAGKTVHAAVDAGCDSCHKAPHAKKKAELSLLKPLPELCFGCHDETGFRKRTTHAPVAGGMCTACHNPHASREKKLLTGAVPGLCYGCHDQTRFQQAIVHAPVASGDCILCHSPHAADVFSLLTRAIPGLCATCHEDKKSGRHVLAGYGLGDDHPIRGKIDPRRPGKELSCTSCHDPHASKTRKLFPAGATDTHSLCLRCHTKVSVRP